MGKAEERQAPIRLSHARRWVTGVVGTAVLLSVAGVLAAQLIKSPAQAVADTAPPPPSVITAPVEQRILKDTVIIRGTVTSSSRSMSRRT